jgi:hypothetical protein
VCAVGTNGRMYTFGVREGQNGVFRIFYHFSINADVIRVLVVGADDPVQSW